jgi:hypothetical protein
MKKIANLTWASDTHTSTRDENKDWVLTNNETGDEIARQHNNGSIVNHIGDLESRRSRVKLRVDSLTAQLADAQGKFSQTVTLIQEAFVSLDKFNDDVSTKRSARNEPDEPVLTSNEVACSQQAEASEESVSNDPRTVAQLRIIACDVNVIGRHRMNKGQLIAAIENAS